MRRASGETERVRRIYDANAGRYDREMALFERAFFRGDREWVAAQASGRVLEIAIGTGRNLPHYPPAARVFGIDASAGMLAVSRERAASLGVSAGLALADAQALPFRDATFDAVVITFALCSIPDDRRAIAEARRVLRPGGLLLLAEHVRSPAAGVRLLEWALDWLMVRFEGDHLLRDPLDHLAGAGFAVERVERRAWGIAERVRAHRR